MSKKSVHSFNCTHFFFFHEKNNGQVGAAGTLYFPLNFAVTLKLL